MKKTDTCFYLSITKEENSAFIVANHAATPEKEGMGGSSAPATAASCEAGLGGDKSLQHTANSILSKFTLHTLIFLYNQHFT